jgi:hypothetical protein
LICGYQLKTCRTNPQKKVLRVDQKKKQYSEKKQVTILKRKPRIRYGGGYRKRE